MNMKEFVNPSKKYRPTSLWLWNNIMEAAEIETRVREMKRKGFGGFFIRAGAGLRTQYMEDDWMRAVRRAVETAREVELECWLCDEDRGPSGYGGGKTADNADSFCAMALSWFENAASVDAELLDDAVAYTRKKEDGTLETLTEKPDSLDGYGVFVASRLTVGNAFFNGGRYPDLLNEDAVKEFIENTHERYSKLFRYDFGEFMPGILTQEPTVERSSGFPEDNDISAVSFPWSNGFADFFTSTFGYSPIDHLHHLLSGSDEGLKFRYEYRQAISEYFLHTFTIPLAAWCREHDLKFTGYMPGEEDFRDMIPAGGPVMSHYEYMDIPGMDHKGRCAGIPWAVKQASSVANQLDRERSLAVLFRGAGHDASFEDMKRIADYHFALGVTHIAPHAAHFSLKGDRKRDYPPAISYHQPYWEHLRVINDYLARCSWAMSTGRSAANVLVLSPSGSAAALLDRTASDGGERVKRLQRSWQAVVQELSFEHISFDAGDERILKRHGSADGATVKIGRSGYTVVVLPPAVTWRSSTLDILESFTGTIIVMGEIPTRVDGIPDDRIRKMIDSGRIVTVPDDPRQIAEKIISVTGRDVSVTGENGREIRSVLVNHRIDAGAHMIFLANTEKESPMDVTISLKALGGVVELDALSGRAYRYASQLENGITSIGTTLYPSGSRIFLVDQTQTSVPLAQAPESVESALMIEGPYTFTRNQDNTLILDRCTLEMDGKTILKNAPLRKVKNAILEKTGIDEYIGFQPWSIEKRNVRTRTNRTVLTYTFEVRDKPEALSLALESADKFTVKINGNKVEPTPGKWHLDKRIPVLDIEEHTVEGTNAITLETDFLWDTEIEDIYLYGDFAVGKEDEGFPIIKEPASLDTGSWTDQGYPFYSGTMTYKMEFDLEFGETDFFEIDLSGSRGSNFFIRINDTDVGSLPFHPFRAEITGALRQGKNTIEAEVAGTLRNTLGPFHYKPGEEPDIIGPDAFSVDEGAGAHYFVPYGFTEPPVLVKITEGEYESPEDTGNTEETITEEST